MISPGKILTAFIYILLLTALSCRKKKSSSGDFPPPPLSSVKSINTFVIAAGDNSNLTLVDIDGQIGTDTITVTFQEGTNLASVVPTVLFSGLSVSPQSRIPQNFGNPLSYVVTAEDGSTRRYHVKVNLVKANNVVYFGSNDNNLYALNAGTGALLWKYTTGGPVFSSPLVVNNTVYVGSSDKYLYAINASTGALKWRYQTDFGIDFQSPVVGGNAVFISCTPGYPGGFVYAIDTLTGLLKWRSAGYSIPSSPTYAEGKVFVCSFPDGCRALNAETGNTEYTIPAGISRSNPLYYNGRIYFCGEGVFYCVTAATGTTVWTRPNMLPSGSSPTIDNGVMYVGTADKYMRALDPGTGNELWSRESNGGLSGSGPGVFSSPVVSGNILYADNNDSYFYALNKTNGNNAWTKGNAVIAAGVATGNPTVANGIVYIGKYDNYLYAYDAVDGSQKWRFQTNGAVQSGPCVVDTRGEVYCAGISGAKN